MSKKKTGSFFESWLEALFQLSQSLNLAVSVILGLAVALAVATVLESIYDTPTAQYWVYQARWFNALMILLGINILSVALHRLPWKKRHLPFLLAHAGILILLFGSWMTQEIGLDGTLRIKEGEKTSVVELEQASFVVSDAKQAYTYRLDWLPPHVFFRPFHAQSFGLPYDLEVDQYLTHAEPEISFIEATQKSEAPASAIQILVSGGVMKIRQKLWLWEGSPDWKKIQAGPAKFALNDSFLPSKGQPTLQFFFKNDRLSYVATSGSGKRVTGRTSQGDEIKPGWKGDVRVEVLKVLSRAQPSATYVASATQFGKEAPASAIHVIVGKKADVWIGLGDRVVVELQNQQLTLGYLPKRIVLPFSVELSRFEIQYDPGTQSPASYASLVKVSDKDGLAEGLIEMNEPLERMGYTLYQASYEESGSSERPTVSILSINRDPGRWVKYIGSLLLVLGCILLSAVKYRRKKKSDVAVSHPIAWEAT